MVWTEPDVRGLLPAESRVREGRRLPLHILENVQDNCTKTEQSHGLLLSRGLAATPVQSVSRCLGAFLLGEGPPCAPASLLSTHWVQ